MTKYVPFLLLVLVLATSAHAQAPNCSHPTAPSVNFEYFPASLACATAGSGSIQPNYAFLTSPESCINDNDGTTYATHEAETTGYGQTYCTLVSNLPIACEPEGDQQFVTAAYATGYNQIYLRAYDVEYVSVYLLSPCGRDGTFRQDFWQCLGVFCTGCVRPPKPSGSCWTWSADQCQWVYNATGTCGSSPLLIDVTGRGFFLTSAEAGVRFDISGTGIPVQMGWTAPGAENAFLALPAIDGLIHNGKELFGNFTPQPSCPAGGTTCSPNGFRALAVYDDPKNGGNGDGIIDARDAIFSSLRLWIDANHDGISQPEELHTLQSLGINSISLAYKESEKTDQYGNVFRYRAQVNPGNPTDAGKTAYDVFFVVQGPTTTAKSCPAPPVTGKRPASSILKH